MGCRNIPNDWTDFNEDRALGIKTLAIRYGLSRAARISFAAMATVVLCAALFPLVSPFANWPLYELGSLGAAAWLLVFPSLRWQRELSRESAQAFFNKACFYPLAIFAALALAVVF